MILLSVICFCDVFGGDEGIPSGAFVISGTVRFTHLQGGCWYIFAADGGAYEPMNLSSGLKQDGLPVHLLVRGRRGMASICQIGRIVEILKVLEVGGAPSNSR